MRLYEGWLKSEVRAGVRDKKLIFARDKQRHRKFSDEKRSSEFFQFKQALGALSQFLK